MPDGRDGNRRRVIVDLVDDPEVPATRTEGAFQVKMKWVACSLRIFSDDAVDVLDDCSRHLLW